jgi:hypothetical protein
VLSEIPSAIKLVKEFAIKTAIKNSLIAHYFERRSVKNKACSEIAALLVIINGY